MDSGRRNWVLKILPASPFGSSEIFVLAKNRKKVRLLSGLETRGTGVSSPAGNGLLRALITRKELPEEDSSRCTGRNCKEKILTLHDKVEELRCTPGTRYQRRASPE